MTTDTRTTITSSTTGLSATLPARFAKNLTTQQARDTVVFDAHNPHPVSAAVVRTLRVEKV